MLLPVNAVSDATGRLEGLAPHKPQVFDLHADGFGSGGFVNGGNLFAMLPETKRLEKNGCRANTSRGTVIRHVAILTVIFHPLHGTGVYAGRASQRRLLSEGGIGRRVWFRVC